MKEEQQKRPAQQKNNSFVPMAAALIIFSVAAIYVLYYYRRPDALIKPTDHVSHVLRNDLPPGGFRATLQQEGAAPVVLDSLPNGLISSEAGLELSKTNDGALAYKAGAITGKAPAKTYTLTTPVGGRYTVTLPDGSRVWLNARSSLQFPAIFTGSRREVWLTGQGYFEIAEDITHPFIVHTDQFTLESPGAQLNLKGYEEEPATILTILKGRAQLTMLKAPGADTLLTGTALAGGRWLTQGQQARIAHNGAAPEVQTVDPAYTVGWTQKHFYFNNDSVTAVMRDLERWFGARIVYEGGIPETTVSGKVADDIPLSLVLNFLRGTGEAHFRQDNGTVYVSKR